MLQFFVFLLSEALPKNALVTPPQKNGNDCKLLRESVLFRARGMLDVTISHFIQFYNFQASLNHRENSCS
jgi:hypothetical protein